MRGQPVLGEGLRVEVILLGMEQQRLDASCFRLVQPTATDDLPWLRKASLGVRRGAETVLEIRSEVPLREPIMQMRVVLGCGHEISRDYVLMASPARVAAAPAAPARQDYVGSEPPASPVERRPPRVRPAAPPAADEAPFRLAPRRTEKRRAASDIPDRLLLSGADGGTVGEPSLRLATELLSATVAKETQRDILRLEYRMLMALHEQAASQMATAEKLRDMEGTLAELQARTAEFAQRVEKEASAPAPAQPASPAPVGVAPGEAPVASAGNPQPKPFRVNESAGDTAWSLYGLAAGMLFGLAAWFGWRRYREARDADADSDPFAAIPEVRVDPQRHDEYAGAGAVDLHFEPAAAMPMSVDVELDDKALHPPLEFNVQESAPPVSAPDSVLSISTTTLSEQSEVNPVMELADIMLSFGRVKGAAQALQEFIDHNPEEALLPWIRLMDVYRMAGMRAEFESVASNLNQHFNVEVQNWDAEAVRAPGGEDTDAIAPRPQSLEDMPRLMGVIADLWESGDVVGYLYQLLRDNRGGQRQGFAMPVVDDILFLIELKETANRME
ncbi:hypothetical protein LZ012_08745 [Dechloromonas sp. XY25]|uniref:Tfp pilus assembly protein FimV n=1 Tax=Dechloromonas hankyongensis TaxID=2908002 RepID=A0ABS9K1N0_9RHOO|nr:hypothetical protein [Dechloromonas hankyongensis]MCG2577084.1 hypothetical protein [Dechloromonas hankyongensis]